jgi:hypothetical protein
MSEKKYLICKTDARLCLFGGDLHPAVDSSFFCPINNKHASAFCILHARAKYGRGSPITWFQNVLSSTAALVCRNNIGYAGIIRGFAHFSLSQAVAVSAQKH